MWKEKKGSDKRRADAAKARKEAAKAAKVAVSWRDPSTDDEEEEDRKPNIPMKKNEKETMATAGAAKATVVAENRKPTAAAAMKKRVEATKKGTGVVVPKKGQNQPTADDPEPENRKSIAMKKRDEAIKRRAETRLLAKQEEEELEKISLIKKLGREKLNKVTRAELEIKKEQEEEALKNKIKEKNNSRITIERKYKEIIDVKNTNKKVELSIDARTIDEAIDQLYSADDFIKDPKLKALFLAFEEEQLPNLKEDKPGLSDYQYKDLMWKMWKRSGYVGDKGSSVSNQQKKKKREERKPRGKTSVLESF